MLMRREMPSLDVMLPSDMSRARVMARCDVSSNDRVMVRCQMRSTGVM